jgi:hypothetical protein
MREVLEVMDKLSSYLAQYNRIRNRLQGSAD